MLAIACGYEDADGLDHLRIDPGFKLACGRLPDTGRDLCSQPTVSRWENALDLREVVRLADALAALHQPAEGFEAVGVAFLGVFVVLNQPLALAVVVLAVDPEVVVQRLAQFLGIGGGAAPARLGGPGSGGLLLGALPLTGSQPDADGGRWEDLIPSALSGSAFSADGMRGACVAVVCLRLDAGPSPRTPCDGPEGPPKLSRKFPDAAARPTFRMRRRDRLDGR
jgi:hypothetical protein